MHRRDFVKTTVQGIAVATTPTVLSAQQATLDNSKHSSPAIHTRRVRPLCIADVSSIRFTNGGSESAIERAFRGISSGEDVLDAIVAGVNIPELDPEERGIGYGGLPNADGVVQLDSCLMHGPKKWAGGVAGIEGVKTPSLLAKAVAELTDHHLIVGQGAQDFARAQGFEIHDDLNTENRGHFGLSGDVELTPAIGLTLRIECEEVGSQNKMDMKQILMLLMTPNSKISTKLHLMQAYQWWTIT